MKKERYCIEFVFEKVGKSILWEYIATAAGLSEWFADKASSIGRRFSFKWSKAEADAEVTALSQGNYIRFHWLDEDDPSVFFELRLSKNDLTGDIVLQITDFADNQEKESSINLWDSQIKTLRRTIGLV